MIESPEEKAKHRIRQLIWLYLWLLLLEGVLRKWVMPRFSDPLLLIRDPVVLAIYYYAIRARVFPRNGWVASLWIIALLSLVASICLARFSLVSGYVPPIPILEVTLYGMRANFFHLPVIFVMANVFDEEDIKKFGWWIIVAMIPMGLLMAAQFKASPDSFINRTAGLGDAEQITSGGGKIRPPGTFSFITGPVFFMSVSAAFLIYGALRRTVYNNWLMIASGAALAVSIFISGSKSSVVAVLLVVIALGVILIVRPREVNRFGWTLVIVVVGALIVSRLPIFKEGFEILSDRFTSAAEVGETTVVGGTIERVISDFTEGLRNMNTFPLFGYGIGIGTNVGGRILVGRPAILLGESEWTRVLAESGPILGLAFLLWRTLLVLQLGRWSFAALKQGNLLPILLFGSGFTVLLNGQFGQPTLLGFAVILNGLCLAATRRHVVDSSTTTLPMNDQPVAKPIPRNSPFARRLHSPEIGAKHNNGSADR
jgi:hypothetical protein